MTHRYTLHLVPADLDRLLGTLTRAGAASVPVYESAHQVLAGVDALARSVRVLAAAHDRDQAPIPPGSSS